MVIEPEKCRKECLERKDLDPMKRTMLRSKIHRATVTEADVDYEGSITIDSDLMQAAGLAEYELVHVADIDTGARLETYVMTGPAGSGIICLNGAAARLIGVGERIIIMAYGQADEPLPADWRPSVVLVDERNRVREVRHAAVR
jgi:aspartate 1-decarboxylase